MKAASIDELRTYHSAIKTVLFNMIDHGVDHKVQEILDAHEKKKNAEPNIARKNLLNEIAALIAKDMEGQEGVLLYVFKKFDRDSDGRLDLGELRNALEFIVDENNWRQNDKIHIKITNNYSKIDFKTFLLWPKF